MAEPENSKLYFSATNPCHLYELCLKLHERHRLGGFYCGYPRQRLRPPPSFPYRQTGWRTTATYAALRLPAWARPDDGRIFRWQDVGFDRRVATRLPPAGVLHGLPGQCLASFEAARRHGLITVLNHASGPIEQQLRLVEPEYARAGVPFRPAEIYPRWWIERQAAERDLAQFHCVASTVVRAQLVADGVPGERIMIVPYGAEPSVFKKRSETPQGKFRILFAGQLSLRKGVHYLLEAVRAAGRADWEVHTYGPINAETRADFEGWQEPTRVCRHSPVSQPELAKRMREASVLVLPSAEEAFGLVVVQALQVGVPCIVSDRVGAKDLIEEGVNGSIVPFGDSAALGQALQYWENHPTTVERIFDWTAPSDRLLDATRKISDSHGAHSFAT